MKHGDIEVALDVDPEKGLADSGDLNSDLSELMLADGGVGTRPPSVRGCGRTAQKEGHKCRANSKRFDRERNDLQSCARRYGIYCAAIRWIHETDHSNSLIRVASQPFHL